MNMHKKYAIMHEHVCTWGRVVGQELQGKLLSVCNRIQQIPEFKPLIGNETSDAGDSDTDS